MNNCNQYNHRIAETMVEVFFKKHGFLVQSYGIENIVGGLELIDSHKIVNSDAKDVISQIMTMPDFVIMKLNENQLKEVYLIDVKYRTFANYDKFKEAVGEDGELYKQAVKYKKLWKGQVHIFLIAKIGDKIYSHYGSANHITDCNFIKPLNSEEHKWINKDILAEYNNKVESVFSD